MSYIDKNVGLWYAPVDSNRNYPITTLNKSQN